jgi:hypothetical protein
LAATPDSSLEIPMLKRLPIALLLTTLSLGANARDDRLKMPIQDALNTPAAKQKLDPSVKLFFGSQSYPKPERTFGTYTSNKKTNFFNKSDKEGCEWVFLSAALSLQERAKAEGGNAMVNIQSVYRNQENSSTTDYDCGAGSVMGGVALRGTVVKLP